MSVVYCICYLLLCVRVCECVCSVLHADLLRYMFISQICNYRCGSWSSYTYQSVVWWSWSRQTSCLFTAVGKPSSSVSCITCLLCPPLAYQSVLCSVHCRSVIHLLCGSVLVPALCCLFTAVGYRLWWFVTEFVVRTGVCYQLLLVGLQLLYLSVVSQVLLLHI